MNMNKNQKYFEELQQYFTERIYRKYDAEIIEIAKFQNKSKETILNELGRFLLDIGDIENLKNKDRIIERIKFQNLIDKVFEQEVVYETEKCEEIHTNTAKDKYYSNCFIYSIGAIDYTLKPVKDDVLKKIINKKIDGKNFSDRIWSNKNAVAKKLKLEINRFLNGENNISDISKAIEKKFNANLNNSNRLVRDSIGRVQEGANAEWRKNHNIKYVMWDSTLDSHTCSDCGALDGKVFEEDKAPIPPKHPLCRCTLISLVNKDWRPTYRIDNETKERVDWQSYQEWMINYNNGLDNDNKLLNIPEKTLKHVYEGDFTNPKNPKKIKPGEIRLRGGGHSQKSIELLNDKKIEYNIVKEYSNGVRVGNVPNHKEKAKKEGTKQAWFPKNWNYKDIQKSAEYVANLKNKNKYILEHNKDKNGDIISIFKFANYNGVTVGICYDYKLKKITTIFPDESQRMLGGVKNE